MPELSYLNGRLVPANELSVAVHDAGFVQGVTVAEQLRTFHGQLFRWEAHLQRLARSLEIIGVQLDLPLEALTEPARQLVQNNRATLDDGDDLGLSLFVTPGPYPTFAPPGGGSPTVAMHTYPLPFWQWAAKYETGQRLVVTDVRQVPASCWSPELKCRSRMHYYLADREAARIDPNARALLLDQQGLVMEASTANLILHHPRRGWLSPPREKILPGVSVHELAELLEAAGERLDYDDLTVTDVQAADEVLLSSTSPCVLPVASVDGQPIGGGAPGPRFRRLIRAWSDLVGVDIIGQARQFQNRVPPSN